MAEQQSDTLAARYGRTRTNRTRDRLLLIGGGRRLRGRARRLGRVGGPRRPEAVGRGHRPRPPAAQRRRAVEVSWTLSVPPGNETACIVQALNEDFTVVGWKVVEIPASDQPPAHVHRDGARRARGEHGFDLALLAHLNGAFAPADAGASRLSQECTMARTPPSPGSRRRPTTGSPPSSSSSDASVARRSPSGSRPRARRATSRRTAATTPRRTSRASRRRASASSPSCCARAQVGEAPESSGVVEPGTVITAVIAGDEETFLHRQPRDRRRLRARRLQRADARSAPPSSA